MVLVKLGGDPGRGTLAAEGTWVLTVDENAIELAESEKNWVAFVHRGALRACTRRRHHTPSPAAAATTPSRLLLLTSHPARCCC